MSAQPATQLRIRRPRPYYARPLTPTGNLRRRQLVSRIAEGGAMASALLAVGVLGIVVYTVVARGAAAIGLAS